VRASARFAAGGAPPLEIIHQPACDHDDPKSADDEGSLFVCETRPGLSSWTGSASFWADAEKGNAKNIPTVRIKSSLRMTASNDKVILILPCAIF
jgi:hypothetical protein